MSQSKFIRNYQI